MGDVNNNREHENIFESTWARLSDSLNKSGFIEGAVDGRNSTYQLNFDKGYAEGLNFGIILGFNEGVTRLKSSNGENVNFKNPKCQICTNGSN